MPARSRLILAWAVAVTAATGLLGLSASAADAAMPPAPSVAGAQLLANGQPLQLRGVDYTFLLDDCDTGDPEPNAAQTISAMQSWGVNTVRMTVNPYCWLGIPPRGAATGNEPHNTATYPTSTAYQNAVKARVEAFENAGFYVIVNPWSTDYMPDPIWVPFWQSAAKALAGEPDVIFDAVNEIGLADYDDGAVTTPESGPQADPVVPGDTTGTDAAMWDCWEKGCTIDTAYGISGYTDTSKRLDAPGMQDLVNAIRGTGTSLYPTGTDGSGNEVGAEGANQPTGATQPILIGAPGYDFEFGYNGNDADITDGWLAHEPTDPDHAIIADAHNYDFTWFNNNNDDAANDGGNGYGADPAHEGSYGDFQTWLNDTLVPLAQHVPVVLGELGEQNCDTTQTPDFTALALSHLDAANAANGLSIGALGYEWRVGDGNFLCPTSAVGQGGPLLLRAYDGTPTVSEGAAFQSWLQAHAGLSPGGGTGAPAGPSRLIGTFAGTGLPCSDPTASSGACGDGTYWGAASFNHPSDIQPIPAAQGGGWLVADEDDFRVRRLGPDGSVTTVAGNGTQCPSSTPSVCHTNSGAATSAELGDSSAPTPPPGTVIDGLAPLPDGGFLIADRAAGEILKVSADDGSGTISVVAGSGAQCAPLNGTSCQDGSPAAAADFDEPDRVVAFDGGYLVTEITGNRVRFVAANGNVYTILGQVNGTDCTSNAAPANFCGFNSGAPNYATQVDTVTNPLSIYLQAPNGISLLPADGSTGGFVVANSMNGTVIEVTGLNLADLKAAGSGVVEGAITSASATLLAGRLGRNQESAPGGLAVDADLNLPSQVAVAGDGTVVVVDAGGQVVHTIAPDGTIATIAGISGAVCDAPTTTAPACGDGGLATAGTFNGPLGVSIAGDGSVLVTDSAEDRIRCIDDGLTPPAGETAAEQPGCSAPAVSGLDTTTGPQAGGTVVTITGTDLSYTTSVMFGGQAATNLVVVSPTEIQATAPASATAGPVDVIVHSPYGTSATVAADQFSYTAPASGGGMTGNTGPTGTGPSGPSGPTGTGRGSSGPGTGGTGPTGTGSTGPTGTGSTGPTGTSGKAAPPRASGLHAGGFGGKTPKLRFTLTAAAGTSLIARLTLALPKGLSFGSPTKLRKGTTVKGSGRSALTFTASVKRGVLTLQPRAPSASLSVAFQRGALMTSAALRHRARSRHPGTITIAVTVVNSAGVSQKLLLTFKL